MATEFNHDPFNSMGTPKYGIPRGAVTVERSEFSDTENNLGNRRVGIGFQVPAAGTVSLLGYDGSVMDIPAVANQQYSVGFVRVRSTGTDASITEVLAYLA